MKRILTLTLAGALAAAGAVAAVPATAGETIHAQHDIIEASVDYADPAGNGIWNLYVLEEHQTTTDGRDYHALEVTLAHFGAGRERLEKYELIRQDDTSAFDATKNASTAELASSALQCVYKADISTSSSVSNTVPCDSTIPATLDVSAVWSGLGERQRVTRAFGGHGAGGSYGSCDNSTQRRTINEQEATARLLVGGAPFASNAEAYHFITYEDVQNTYTSCSAG